MGCMWLYGSNLIIQYFECCFSRRFSPAGFEEKNNYIGMIHMARNRVIASQQSARNWGPQSNGSQESECCQQAWGLGNVSFPSWTSDKTAVPADILTGTL